ncbi:MAG: bifunctional 3,4-dihydroxy-2-butanone-4-phosphate synthase/GTP cyclohydrolase II [Fidelibacterota bacterium]
MGGHRDLSSIEDALESIRRGKMVIVKDDEKRENEADFIMPAETATPEAINFMCRYGRGLICVALSEERAGELGLEEMVGNNTALHGTRFTVSVDAMNNTTTGISAFDRFETIRALIDPETTPRDLGRPGHVFPLVARPGGVLERAGHTEAAVDLSRLAGFGGAGVITEILDDDGRMAQSDRLFRLAEQHGLKIMSIADLITYRQRREKLVECEAVSELPSRWGDFKLRLYRNIITDECHLALVKGTIKHGSTVLVRVHSECLTGDVLGSFRCDCGDQLRQSLKMIGRSGSGVLLYLRQEGRGVGLNHKIKAYEYQDRGMDTVEANEKLGFSPDLREYGTGARILYDLGVRKMRLLTNNPQKIVAFDGYGLKVVERVPLETVPRDANRKYLETKRDKLGHLILGNGGKRDDG